MEKTNSYWVLGHRVAPMETTGNYDLATGETAPGVPGPPPHHHQEYDEVFLITEGSLTFHVNGEEKVVHSGESIDLPKGCIHTFSNHGDSPAKWINIHSPKGFRSFFETFGIPSAESDSLARSADPELIQKVVQECHQFDMHLAPMPARA